MPHSDPNNPFSESSAIPSKLEPVTPTKPKSTGTEPVDPIKSPHSGLTAQQLAAAEARKQETIQSEAFLKEVDPEFHLMLVHISPEWFHPKDLFTDYVRYYLAPGETAAKGWHCLRATTAFRKGCKTLIRWRKKTKIRPDLGPPPASRVRDLRAAAQALLICIEDIGARRGQKWRWFYERCLCARVDPGLAHLPHGFPLGTDPYGEGFLLTEEEVRERRKRRNVEMQRTPEKLNTPKRMRFFDSLASSSTVWGYSTEESSDESSDESLGRMLERSSEKTPKKSVGKMPAGGPEHMPDERPRENLWIVSNESLRKSLGKHPFRIPPKGRGESSRKSHEKGPEKSLEKSPEKSLEKSARKSAEKSPEKGLKKGSGDGSGKRPAESFLNGPGKRRKDNSEEIRAGSADDGDGEWLVEFD